MELKLDKLLILINEFIKLIVSIVELKHKFNRIPQAAQLELIVSIVELKLQLLLIFVLLYKKLIVSIVELKRYKSRELAKNKQ